MSKHQIDIVEHANILAEYFTMHNDLPYHERLIQARNTFHHLFDISGTSTTGNMSVITFNSEDGLASFLLRYADVSGH